MRISCWHGKLSCMYPASTVDNTRQQQGRKSTYVLPPCVMHVHAPLTHPQSTQPTTLPPRHWGRKPIHCTACAATVQLAANMERLLPYHNAPPAAAQTHLTTLSVPCTHILKAPHTRDMHTCTHMTTDIRSSPHNKWTSAAATLPSLSRCSLTTVTTLSTLTAA